MPVTALGLQVETDLERIRSGETAKTIEDLHGWFDKFQKQLQREERRECRELLGLPIDEEVPFRELVPEGWLGDVLELTKEAESPTPFFFLAALSVLSQAVGRKVMVDRGTHELGLDISALLISPAGKTRRSTACDFVVYKLGEPAGINIIADSFSYEAFADELVQVSKTGKVPKDRKIEGSEAIIYAGEMAVLLGKNSYADSIIPKLTDLLGKTSRFEWRTVKRGGKLVFYRPCVNALFTTAPDWLVDNIPPVMFGGGMLSRFLICVQEDPARVVTWGDKISQFDIDECVARLVGCREVRGWFGKPEGEVFRWYDDWYQRHTAKALRGDIPDERMAPYFSRKHDHLLRIAALLIIAAGEPLVFTTRRLVEALGLLEWLEVSIPKAYSNMALSPIASAQKAVYRTLQKAGGRMEHSRLQKAVYRHCPLAQQFSAVIGSLIDMRVVQSVSNLSGKRGKTYLLTGELQ